MKKALLLAACTAVLGIFTMVTLPDVNAQSARDISAELDKIRSDSPAFKIEFKADPDKGTFNSDEEIKFRVTSEQDGYLTILDYGTSKSVVVLFPNEWHKSSKIEKGVTYDIPPADGKFKYLVKVPGGTESLKAIVSPNPIVEYGDSPAKGLEKKGPFMKFKNPRQAIKDIAVQQSQPGPPWTVVDLTFNIAEGQGSSQGSQQQGTTPGFSPPSQ